MSRGAPADPAARLVALRGAFTERHLPLYALLGLRARLDRVAALLPTPSPEAPAPAALSDLDLALLGVAALRAKLAAALPGPDGGAAAGADGTGSLYDRHELGDLLR